MKHLKAFAAIVLLLASHHILKADDLNYDEDPYFLLSGQADKAIEEGRYEDAEARLNEAMAMRPDSPTNLLLRSNLAAIYAGTGRDSLAISTFDDILQSAPQMTTAIRLRARVLLKNGQLLKAQKGFEHLLQLDSLNSEGRFYHGMISLMSHDTIAAETDFEILRALEPMGDNTATAMSALYTARGDMRAALPYVRRVAAADPDAVNLAALARNLIALEEYSEAGTTLADAISKFPRCAELYAIRAKLNRALFRMADADADEQKAKTLHTHRNTSAKQ